MSASASGSSAGKGSAQNRKSEHTDGSSTRAYTTEQKAAVIRVRRCSPTAFYEILGVEKDKSTIDENGIKKAYRKLSLLTHPDKNGYDGADEAFKMVSRAFQILGDTDKRRMFDQTGGDPDSRSGGGGGGGQSPFAGFARSPGMRQGGFEAEISPEELFRQFFGGGGMGGGFGSPFGMFEQRVCIKVGAPVLTFVTRRGAVRYRSRLCLQHGWSRCSRTSVRRPTTTTTTSRRTRS